MIAVTKMIELTGAITRRTAARRRVMVRVTGGTTVRVTARGKDMTSMMLAIIEIRVALHRTTTMPVEIEVIIVMVVIQRKDTTMPEERFGMRTMSPSSVA